MNYYNDNDPKACARLRELIAAGEIAPGHVDERSILEIKPDDLAGFDQCHFFAGIGGWALALQWAGWPGYRSVWTGSCPCQPFSAAGKRKGAADDRHLWPVFARLIRECRPECVFGEQVESAIGLGWLDGVCADMEAEGYTVGAAVLGAHSVGAPHRRQRLYWVADTNGAGCQTRGHDRVAEAEARGSRKLVSLHDGGPSVVADSQRAGLEGFGRDGDGRNEPGREHAQAAGHAAASGATGGLGNAEGGDRQVSVHRQEPFPDRSELERASGPCDWSRFDIVICRDIDKQTGKHKARRVESGTFPLAHGVPGRVGLLRGYGNAIVPQVAEVFVRAWMDCRANKELETKNDIGGKNP